MESTFIDRLPVKLHICIFNYLLAHSRDSYLESPSEEYEDQEAEAALWGRPPPTPSPRKLVRYWTGTDSRSPYLFPFNVAKVCTKWRDILSQFPVCWTRIVFDVATDPTPLLEAFSWSKDLEGLEVVVFTSAKHSKDTDKETKARENQRVAAIARAFRPHAHQCKSISFDVVYESSLPPPSIFFLREAPALEELTLECVIYDAFTGNLTSTPTIGEANASLATLG
ncbi:hypothetical protein GALMADRAFT_139724 [Galerina marginata CBS 339.88]|uniref:F-box domain-containing protein n=1 Tax=Galerina marginata (strain CBS 339.88) TaxID=685588 RepID=A0A067TAE0_GALM3|nr:hypothetical protein GALMADRAFT_139724 [Galerina marginata CBS 339.88]